LRLAILRRWLLIVKFHLQLWLDDSKLGALDVLRALITIRRFNRLLSDSRFFISTLVFQVSPFGASFNG
jgi:hypothetical protein